MSRVGNRCLCILSLHGEYERIAFPDGFSMFRCVDSGRKCLSPFEAKAVAADRIDMVSRAAYHSYLARTPSCQECGNRPAESAGSTDHELFYDVKNRPDF